jgi:hypothetical protein
VDKRTQWKNGINRYNCYQNGLLKCIVEAQFHDDEPNGYGRAIFHDGEYFIGHFEMSFNVRNGILYNSDGSIKIQGEWMEDPNASLSFSEKYESEILDTD